MNRVLLLYSCVICAAAAQDATSGENVPLRKDTIVVTGTYEPIPLDEADRSVKSYEVEGQELLSNSLVDFLRLEPSLDLRQRAPNGIQSDLSIRGGTFGQTLILLDGVRLNDAQSGHHNMDIPVPLESVSRVEILRGAGSTLYGSDAVGGVVNLITRKPDVSEFRLRTAAGNFGVNQQRGSLTAVTSKLTQQFLFSRDFSSGFLPDRDYRNLSLASNSHLLTPWGPAHVLLAHSDRPFGADNFYGNFNSWERTKNWLASLRQGLGKDTEASFAFRRHTDLFVLYRDRPEVFTNRHAVEGYQGALRRHEEVSQNTKLHYGAEGYRDAIVSNNLGTHSRWRGAGYAALDVRAVRRFSFSLGAREEIYGSLAGQFSPTVSGGAWLSEHLKLRASASRAFRLPSYTDLYYHDPANQGSPELRPEEAWSYEGGLDWNMAGRLRGDVTIFHRRETNGIDYVRYSPTDIWRAVNIQRLHFTGIEASVGVPAGRSQRLDFQYTGLHGTQSALASLVSRYVFNYPTHSAVASWQGFLPGGLVGRAQFGARQRFAQDAYALIDVYLARRKGRLRPFLQFTNLANKFYQEISGVPMPGRAVVGGIEIVVFHGSQPARFCKVERPVTFRPSQDYGLRPKSQMKK
jgi:iron complex outermembrane receptor protein